MSRDPQPSGRDLARMALDNYKSLGARMAAGRKKTKPRVRYTPRGSGRDPVGLGDITGGLLDNWQPSMDGGSIISQWPAIAPGLVGRVAPIHYDADRGRLDLRPASSAYATQLRLFATQTAKLINDKLGREAVRTIRVLPVGALPAGHRVEDEPPADAPTTTERPIVRVELPAEFHHARQAMRDVRTQTAGDPRQGLRDRYFATSRGTLREPEPPTPLEQPTPTGGSNPAHTRQAAIDRARQERAGRTPAVPTAFQQTA